MSSPSAPTSAQRFACSTVYAVSLSPAPESTFTFEPTVLFTTLIISNFSEVLVVGASPVVPLTAIAS